MGDVTDPFSWQDAQGAVPPKDYAGSGAAYQYAAQLPDTSMPIQYLGAFRSGTLQIPWQYEPGDSDLGAFINLSIDGGATWRNNQVAPVGGGQSLTGTMYVNLTGARLVLVQVTRGPSLGILAGIASMSLDASATPTQPHQIAGTAGMTLGQSGALKGIGQLVGSTGITFGQSGSLIANAFLTGSAALTLGASGTLTAIGALAGSTALTLGQSGHLTAASTGGSYSGTMVAGSGFGGVGVGTSYGYSSGSFGSITPTTDNNGRAVQRVQYNPTGQALWFQIAANVPQSYFTNLVLNGATLSSAIASFIPWNGFVTEWDWNAFGAHALVPGNTYPFSYS
jgi:hypothetical protein